MPGSQALHSTGYQPRSATNQLKEIVEEHYEELFRDWDERFRERYGALPARVRTLLERFLRCGDLHCGFLRLRCTNPNCPEKTELLVPHSCKVRGLCPSCCQKRALLWAERLVEEVLPLVPYRQLVFTIPRCLRPSFLRDRLLSYMERAPVSLKRLTYRDDGMVHYQGTKVHPRLGVDHQLLPALEFLALLVPHILLRYQVSSRLYGAISSRTRKSLGWLEQPPTRMPPPEHGPAPQFATRPPAPGATPGSQGHPPAPRDDAPQPRGPEHEPQDDAPFVRERRRSWARLIAQTWLCDPELCPVCGARRMVVAAISSPAQDDVIQKILQHVNRWNPPWKRGRKAPGPPPSSTSGLTPGGQPIEQSDGIDPQWDFESYLVDPPAPEDP